MNWVQDGVPVLVGKTLTSVEVLDDDTLVFRTTEGKNYYLTHEQDCCESVVIEDVCGDIQHLVGSPILMAEEAQGDVPAEVAAKRAEEGGWGYESETWTFYKFATIKGYVTVRFWGQSNGYYGETADLYESEA